jgi:alpha-tubulin suppressor-like RCC1 family protein
VKDDGTIKCGGLNDANQAGASPSNPELDGFDVGLGGVQAISSGNDHTCAVVDVGAPGSPALAVKCWGKNGKGQLGRDTASAPSGVPDYVGK